ncbi:hypothetical protein GCM10010193_40170 [Kitasatospora atroaurantiaca]|uniref:hypothetical protein n=1 Tax=Kitasatospora atroaurantiaca TaxID=285545 RepID=UPI0011A5799B|nr:hypothetical protein [Kitasatospora atroaurantiaca]
MLAALRSDELATAVGPEPDWNSAAFVDARTIVAGVEDFLHGDGRTEHWLLDARTLHPLGRIDYPHPVGEHVVGLGDGTWLTTDPDDATLRRWTAPADLLPG